MRRATTPFNLRHLLRRRVLNVRQRHEPGLAIPATSIYNPIREYLTRIDSQYPFRMMRMLHVAGLKMLQPLGFTKPRQTLFATGGLYLALDQDHPNLCFQDIFGDFTSGFSHQFGVALSVMMMSEAYSIPWHEFNAIKVRGQKVLDYEAPLPFGGYLQVEAKGVSGGTSAARSSITAKKRIARNNGNSLAPTAMLGVIVAAARSKPGMLALGHIEIIDPDLPPRPEWRTENGRIAARYLHYAGVALFAGLYPVATELLQRAKILMTFDQQPEGVAMRFADEATILVEGSPVIGVQWRLGAEADPQSDTWFQHGVDLDRIRPIVEKAYFPEAEPFNFDTFTTFALDDIDQFLNEPGREQPSPDISQVDSMLPDGSFFGLSIGPRFGLLRLDRGETNLQRIKIIELNK